MHILFTQFQIVFYNRVCEIPLPGLLPMLLKLEAYALLLSCACNSNLPVSGFYRISTHTCIFVAVKVLNSYVFSYIADIFTDEPEVLCPEDIPLLPGSPVLCNGTETLPVRHLHRPLSMRHKSAPASPHHRKQ